MGAPVSDSELLACLVILHSDMAHTHGTHVTSLQQTDRSHQPDNLMGYDDLPVYADSPGEERDRICGAQ